MENQQPGKKKVYERFLLRNSEKMKKYLTENAEKDCIFAVFLSFTNLILLGFLCALFSSGLEFTHFTLPRVSLSVSCFQCLSNVGFESAVCAQFTGHRYFLSNDKKYKQICMYTLFLVRYLNKGLQNIQ